MGQPLTAAVRFLSGEREPVRVATTGNIALSGLQTIDDVDLEVGDRVLVKDQDDATENGIRLASEGEWFRAPDASYTRAVEKGVTVTVREGTVNNGRDYRFTSESPRVGIDPIALLWSGPQAAQAGAEAAQAAAEAAQAAAEAAANNQMVFDTRPLAAAATIPAPVNALRLNGSAAEGDSLGGLYIDTDNGSNDTFTSADGRTWYRVADVGASRLNLPLAMYIDSRPESFDKNARSNNTTLDHTVAIELALPGFTTPRGQQGGAVDEKQSHYYAVWNRANGDGITERTNIVRHNIRTAQSGVAPVVDYGETVGPGSGNTWINFGHGQCLSLFEDKKGFLNILTSNLENRGITVCEYQEVGSRCADPEGYDIIVLAGQSNMAGTNTGAVPDPTLDASDERILELREGATSPSVAVEPLGHPTSNLNGYGPGPGLQFAKLYAEKYLTWNRKVLLLPVAVSSTGLTDGGPWAVGGTHYNNMIAKMTAAVALSSGGTNRVVGMLWSQGETDANRTQVGGTSATQAEYTAAWNAVIDGFRASMTAAKYAFIIALGMEPDWVATQTYRAGVQAALADTPAQRKWTAYVAGPSGYPVTAGDLHFNPAGNRLRGELAFAAISSAVENTKGVAAIPGNVRSYDIQPAGVTSGTSSLTGDKQFIIKTGGPYLGGKNIRIVRLADILELPPGDYSARKDLIHEVMQPAGMEFANQGATDENGILVLLNGDNSTVLDKKLYFIRMSDGALVDTRNVSPGRKLAIAQNGGSGDWCEPEGLFELNGKLWTSVGMRDAAGTGWRTFIMPVFQESFGSLALNGNNAPSGVALFLEGGSRKITFPVDETLSFGLSGGGSDGYKVPLGFNMSAKPGEDYKFFVNDPATGADVLAFSIDRTSGKFKLGQGTLEVGGSTPAVGAASAYMNSAGRWLMSLASAGANHFLFRSNTGNAGAIKSTGAITDYLVTGSVGITAYAGDPNNFVTAPVGMLCLDTTNGGAYSKKTGTGNTGWVLLT